MDAKDLANHCEKDLDYAAAYITGFMDMCRQKTIFVVLLEANVKDKEALAMYRPTVLGRFCLPEKANYARAIRIGCDWVETHPEKGDVNAPRALFMAYNAAWPCE
ncbi:hypothetical protein ELH26_33305 (plasmid) [Rhizobium leguminosarum]|uniref:Rap1a/Tai family immunity protein n=1 Tax=Rhizobium leguminosarum TaxID=384 RepID=UPI00102F327D|nr:Rap1a/Tai family immunity protein [Rhizobium leguminosarum]TBC87776.1 hypothetical protein ELH26_33305 [Rhizobium leguminosarum]